MKNKHDKLKRNKPLTFIKYLICFFFVQGIGIIPFHCLAQGNLLIFPTRVVFEGNKKTQEINLSNIGKDTATYFISLVNLKMNETGMFENINLPDSGQFFADKYLRIFPRKVIIPPNESQIVKIQRLKTEQLNQSEYRSHLYFRAEPTKEALGAETENVDTTAISIQLKAVFGITIPVIIRVGESNANVNISDLSFNMVNDSTPVIKMKLNRTGNMSVYGDVEVKYILSNVIDKKAGLAKGVAVYTPNKSRWFELTLDKNISYDPKGKLRVIYSTQQGDKLTEKECVIKIK